MKFVLFQVQGKFILLGRLEEDSHLDSAQNNFYAEVAYLGVAYSHPSHVFGKIWL